MSANGRLLKGLRVLDFTRLLPGPAATHMLGQMGASVFKIEAPQRRDSVRTTHPGLFSALNHNKTCVEIDYQQAAGREDVLARARQADVLIEQFRPGSMDAWGLGYSDLKEANPDLVYVSVHGYGPTGPLASTAGHDINFLATAGLLSLMKDPGGKPVLPGFQLADVAGGAYSTVMALQAALLRRFLSPAGVAGGAHVQVDMTAACVPLLAVPLSLRGAGPLGSDLPNILDGTSAVNYAIYATRDGRYLAVGALESKFWVRVCELIGRPDWGSKSQVELLTVLFPKAELEAVFKSHTLAEWTAVFEGEEVCVTPVLELDEVLSMPYHRERGSFVEVANPTGSTLGVRGGKTVLTAGLPFSIGE